MQPRSGEQPFGLSVTVFLPQRPLIAEEPKRITKGTKRGHKRNFTGTKQVHLIGRAGYKMVTNQVVVLRHPKNCNAKRTWAKLTSPKRHIPNTPREHFIRQSGHFNLQKGTFYTAKGTCLYPAVIDY